MPIVDQPDTSFETSGVGSGVSALGSISAVAAVVGAGLQIYGSIKAAGAQKVEAGISSDIAANEEAINEQREQQMVLNARRSQLEVYRNTQRARAQGLAAATNQGAQYGSGISGGQAQASAQGAFNSLGISQNTQIGQNIFGLTNNIDTLQGQLAVMTGKAATYSGVAALGGDVSRASGQVGQLGSLFAGSETDNG